MCPLAYRSVAYAVRMMKGELADGLSITLQDSTLTRHGNRFFWCRGIEALADGYVSLVDSPVTPLTGNWVLVRGGSGKRDEPGERGAQRVAPDVQVRIDEHQLAFPVVARSAQPGDAIELLEGTKSLSKLYAGWKIAALDRSKIPVLEDEQGVFAVLGKAFGGKDRLARRCRLGTLARNDATLYSVIEYED
jgi:tRNA(Ile)-lysidine synthetase-like protein